ncbi:MAG: hypothetical protein CVU81_00825 [Euryarchaeota archaeon HGW-Euryarchaeota-1]|nr:MAG: hypothetical protein CVU81_00825 [Euryarchaeota archaeon HGW-Euryarchaeota-1]
MKIERKNKSVVDALAEKGYTLKAGLKYGCDYRIYRKGVVVRKGEKQKEEHSFAVLDVVKNTEQIKVKDLVAKARVARASKLQWLVAIDNDKSSKLLRIEWVG